MLPSCWAMRSVKDTLGSAGSALRCVGLMAWIETKPPLTITFVLFSFFFFFLLWSEDTQFLFQVSPGFEALSDESLCL